MTRVTGQVEECWFYFVGAEPELSYFLLHFNWIAEFDLGNIGRGFLFFGVGSADFSPAAFGRPQHRDPPCDLRWPLVTSGCSVRGFPLLAFKQLPCDGRAESLLKTHRAPPLTSLTGHEELRVGSKYFTDGQKGAECNSFLHIRRFMETASFETTLIHNKVRTLARGGCSVLHLQLLGFFLNTFFSSLKQLFLWEVSLFYVNTKSTTWLELNKLTLVLLF